MEQAYNKAVSPIHVRYLYGRYPVYVRYKSGHVPDKYRTYSGQRQEMHRRYAGATIWIEWRYQNFASLAKEMHAGVAQRWDVDTIKIGRILKIWFHSFGFWLRRYSLFMIKTNVFGKK